MNFLPSHADGDEPWEYHPRESLKTQDGSKIGGTRMRQSIDYSLVDESVSD